MKHSFCEDWEFTRHWTEAFGKGLPGLFQFKQMLSCSSVLYFFMQFIDVMGNCKDYALGGNIFCSAIQISAEFHILLYF